MLYDLAQPAAHLARGKGAEEGGIGEYPSGLMKGADEIFDAAKIDGSLSAHRGIHLRQKGGRDLDAVDAAHIERCGEPAHVPDDAAAQTDEAVAAVQPRLRHGGEQRKERFRRFVRLTRGHGMYRHAPEGAHRPRAVQPPHPIVGE